MYTSNGDIVFNTEITSKVYELKELLVNSKEYKDVKEKERLMEENCATLLIKYNRLFEEYNQALKYKDYGSDVASIRKQLHECKLELDENEYVKDYKLAYREINNLLFNIQNIIFDKIIENKSKN